MAVSDRAALLPGRCGRPAHPAASVAPLMRALVLALFVLALADPQSVMRSGGLHPAGVDRRLGQYHAADARLHDRPPARSDLSYRAHDPAMIFATSPVEQNIGGAVANRSNSPTDAPHAVPQRPISKPRSNRSRPNRTAHGGPVVLVTDGWQNHGDADEAVNALRAAGIRSTSSRRRARNRSPTSR